MKRLIACVASMLLPGLGQCFYGRYKFALAFALSSCVFGPLCNLLAALHILIIDNNKEL